jgi:hypothetical protein
MPATHFVRSVLGSGAFSGPRAANAAPQYLPIQIAMPAATRCTLFSARSAARLAQRSAIVVPRRVSRVVAMPAAAEQATLTHIVDASAADAESLAQNNVLMARVLLRQLISLFVVAVPQYHTRAGLSWVKG